QSMDAASKPLVDRTVVDLAAPPARTAGDDASASASSTSKEGSTTPSDKSHSPELTTHIKPAAPIDAATAPQAASAADVEPTALSPDRQPLASPDAQSKPGDAAAALAGLPSPISSQGPDALSPLDPPDATIHADSSRGGAMQDTAQHGGGNANGQGDNSSSGQTTGNVDPAWKHLAAGPARLAPVNIDTTGADASAGASGATGPTAAPAPPPKIYKDRLSSDRSSLLRRRGGSAETEAAVQAALKWLALHQEPDGHFDAGKYGAGHETSALGHDRAGAGTKADTGITGLALLAMLGSGNTHLKGPYARNVQHGLEYLLAIQGADGNLGGQAETFSFMYCHGMATFAMSEDYAITHDRRLEEPLRRAIAFTVAAQHPTTGGWRYRPHEMGDTSQLGWQLMALKSAELAGIPMPEQTRAGAIRFLKSVGAGNEGGLAGYRPGENPSRSMTAEALVCRQFLGMARDNPAADEAGKSLLDELPSKDKVNLYYWYYGTLGMYQLQGEYWQRWNEALQGALVGRQQTDGDAAGSWDPVCVWGGYGGRVYSTAMSALCLEVYYRFLPLYNDPAVAPAAAEPR
ncbi:MAG TPA: prenyltransferase/squalene oxidase repeat-containing protein, partial [Pirellulales bacterium]